MPQLTQEPPPYALGDAVNFELSDDGARCAIDMPLNKAGRIQNHGSNAQRRQDRP